MPEGDTIWAAAEALRGALAGKAVTGFSSPLARVKAAARRFRVVGSRVDGVEAVGKHLLMRFSTGAVLRTHMRMTGSWHLYRRGSRWRKPTGQARAVVEAEDVVAVCFNAPVVELVSRTESRSALDRLGPDILAEEFDEAEAVARLRARGDQEIGVALLDQTALAGIGNVYKSEVLFVRGVNPFARVADLTDEALLGLLRTARRQMRRNVGSGIRRTTSEPSPHRLWIYGRAHEPCLRCGTPIRRRTQGEQARSTYWCPRCQPERVV